MHARIVSVVGLGYVGLPVAIAFGLQNRVIGFDTNEERLAELRRGLDRTNEVSSEELNRSDVLYSSKISDLSTANFHIVAVPTPVDKSNRPDLNIIKSASRTVGAALKKNDIVVYESTVYPGVTNQVCVPILEAVSGLVCGVDFKVGYSPERINPGDREHTFTKIVKVVSGQDEEALDVIASVYGSVVTAGVFRAASIEVAEAAKVIENTQRDLNIALMNELSMIFERMNIDTSSVLEAAATKWNFLNFRPGLVGGHCIGVDPYYLTFKAEELGYHPQVILAGRRINDGIAAHIGQQTIKLITKQGHDLRSCTVTILGLTFKEDCPDLRNTKVIDLLLELKDYGVEKIQVCDPKADIDDVKREYALNLVPLAELEPAECVVLAVPHAEFKQLDAEQYMSLMTNKPILIDVKAICDQRVFEDAGITVWRL